MSDPLEAAWEVHCFLTARQVPYAIIGGLAVQHWGEPRFTRDVDVTVVVPLEQASSFIATVVEYFAPRIENAAAFARRSRVILIWAANGCQVDISLGLPGYEDEVIQRAVDFELEPGKVVRLCGAEDLVIHKAVAGRPRDLEDIKGIVYRRGKALDVSLVRLWLERFSEILGDSAPLERFTEIWRRWEANRRRK
jgi:hypothetical protein